MTEPRRLPTLLAVIAPDKLAVSVLNRSSKSGRVGPCNDEQ